MVQFTMYVRNELKQSDGMKWKEKRKNSRKLIQENFKNMRFSQCHLDRKVMPPKVEIETIPFSQMGRWQTCLQKMKSDEQLLY